MLSEPYFINFKFYITNLSLNQENLFLVINGNRQQFSDSVDILCDRNHIQLNLEHNNTKLYDTQKSFTENYSEIIKIVVDNFWIFRPPFLKNQVKYHKAYTQHVNNYGSGWEIEHKHHCSSLHFNGSLIFNFPVPVVGMFK